MKIVLVAVTCVLIVAHEFCVCIDRKVESSDTTEYPCGSSEDCYQQTNSTALNEISMNSENVGEATQNACLFNNLSETSMMSSSQADEFSLRRSSNESVNVDSRPLPCNDGAGVFSSPMVVDSQITESAGSLSYGNLGAPTFSYPSMPNSCEISRHLELDDLNPQPSTNVDNFDTDGNITHDYLTLQTAEYNEQYQIPDTYRNSRASDILQPRPNEARKSLYSREINPSLVHQINRNDLITEAEIVFNSPTTLTFMNMSDTTSDSFDIHSQNSTQGQEISVALQNNVHLSEFQRHLQSQNATSNVDPNSSAPDIGSSSRYLLDEDAQNRVIHLLLQVSNPSSLVVNHLSLNSGSGPLPYHWGTGTEGNFHSVSLPLNSSSGPLLQYWSTRSHFSCGLQAKIGGNHGAFCNCIFSSLKEIIQTSSETRVGAIDTESIKTNSIQGIRFSEDISSDFDYLRVTLEEMERQFATESSTRNVLLLRPTSVRHLLSEVEITLTEIIQHLPPSPISFRVAAEVLVSRALQRLSTQRRYIRFAACNYRRGSAGGTAEDSFRGLRRVIGIIMEDLSFILALALPILEQFDLER